jgi:diacylglycerol kinase
MLNTVFERLVDMLKPRVHLYVRDIKNITSSMVLITAVSAVIIGILIFGQYLFR